MVRTYRELVAWQRTREPVKEVYLLTAGFPDRERFGLVGQIVRAAVFIPSNIPESYGRTTTHDMSRR